MECDINLVNGRIVSGEKIISGGISVYNGKIIKIGKMDDLFEAREQIDVEQKFVLPGMIDVHVHCRDMDYSYKEDYFTCTAAAIHGGITTIIDMPNSKPPTLSSEVLQKKMNEAKNKILCNVGFYSGMPKDIDDLKKLAKMGIFGIKLLLNNPMTSLDYSDRAILKKLVLSCAKNNLRVLVHPELEKYVNQYQNDATIDSISFFLKRHNEDNEWKTINYILGVCKDIQSHIHFCHLSTAKDIPIISEFKRNFHKLNITSEITPHHLFLTEEELNKRGSFAKMLPPLRGRPNQKKLFHALKTGIVDIIATDHAPHGLEEKNKNFIDAPSGIPGLETSLSLLLTKVKKRKLRIQELCKFYAENPANILNLTSKGKISENYDADLVIVDPEIEYQIDSSKFFTKAKFSPFDGWKCNGKPIMTMIAGKIVSKDDQLIAKRGSGNILLHI
jgi:dihydroorotase